MLNTPFLEEHHRVLAEQAARFVREHVRDAGSSEDEERESRRLVATLGSEGLLAWTVPEAFDTGANSLDVRALCIVREQLSYESSLADLMFAMQGLGSFPLTLAGSPIKASPADKIGIMFIRARQEAEFDHLWDLLLRRDLYKI